MVARPGVLPKAASQLVHGLALLTGKPENREKTGARTNEKNSGMRPDFQSNNFDVEALLFLLLFLVLSTVECLSE
jgi:hypothetical protein